MKKIAGILIVACLIITGCQSEQTVNQELDILELDSIDSTFIPFSEFDKLADKGEDIVTTYSDAVIKSAGRSVYYVSETEEIDEEKQSCNLIIKMEEKKVTIPCEEDRTYGTVYDVNNKVIIYGEYLNEQKQNVLLKSYSLETEEITKIGEYDGDFLSWEPRVEISGEKVYINIPSSGFTLLEYNLENTNLTNLATGVISARYNIANNEICYFKNENFLPGLKQEEGLYCYELESGEEKLLYESNSIRDFVFYKNELYTFESYGIEEQLYSTIHNVKTDEQKLLNLGVINGQQLDNFVFGSRGGQNYIIDLETSTEYLFEKTPVNGTHEYQFVVDGEKIYLENIELSHGSFVSKETIEIGKTDLESYLNGKKEDASEQTNEGTNEEANKEQNGE